MAATSRKLSPSSLTATWSDGNLERLRAQPLSIQQRCTACDEDGRDWPSLPPTAPWRELRWPDEGRERTGGGRPGTAFRATRRRHAGMAGRCHRTAASSHGRQRRTAQRQCQGLRLKRRPRKREASAAHAAVCPRQATLPQAARTRALGRAPASRSHLRAWPLSHRCAGDGNQKAPAATAMPRPSSRRRQRPPQRTTTSSRRSPAAPWTSCGTRSRQPMRWRATFSTAGEPLVQGFLRKGGRPPGPRAAGDAAGYGVDPVAALREMGAEKKKR
jgi:hypothetical protein